jgi:hypothetical protein
LLDDALASIRGIRISFAEAQDIKPMIEALSLEDILRALSLNNCDEKWRNVVLPPLEMVCHGCIFMQEEFQRIRKVDPASCDKAVFFGYKYNMLELPGL